MPFNVNSSDSTISGALCNLSNMLINEAGSAGGGLGGISSAVSSLSSMSGVLGSLSGLAGSLTGVMGELQSAMSVLQMGGSLFSSAGEASSAASTASSAATSLKGTITSVLSAVNPILQAGQTLSLLAETNTFSSVASQLNTLSNLPAVTGYTEINNALLNLQNVFTTTDAISLLSSIPGTNAAADVVTLAGTINSKTFTVANNFPIGAAALFCQLEGAVVVDSVIITFTSLTTGTATIVAYDTTADLAYIQSSMAGSGTLIDHLPAHDLSATLTGAGELNTKVSSFNFLAPYNAHYSGTINYTTGLVTINTKGLTVANDVLITITYDSPPLADVAFNVANINSFIQTVQTNLQPIVNLLTNNCFAANLGGNGGLHCNVVTGHKINASKTIVGRGSVSKAKLTAG